MSAYFMIGALIACIIGMILLGVFTNIIGDTIRGTDGKWSKINFMIFFTFWFNIIYAGWCAYQTAVMPDIPVGWLGLLITLCGIREASNTVVKNAIIKATGTADGIQA